MNEKQHITINIADVAPISLYVYREKEAVNRKIAADVTKMWNDLSAQYTDKTSKDILAMVAFRYAQVYYALLEKEKARDAALVDTEKALDQILLDIE